jgi:hypothetical protein
VPELASFLEIPERTLARRKVAGRLGREESERLLRLSRIFKKAVELFNGDVTEAVSWVATPKEGARRQDCSLLCSHRGRCSRGRKSHRSTRARRLSVSLIVWRIIQRKFATSAFTGDRARRFGGRWNSPPARHSLHGAISLACRTRDSGPC